MEEVETIEDLHSWRSAWSKDTTGRDSISNPKEDAVGKVNIIGRRANTVENVVM